MDKCWRDDIIAFKEGHLFHADELNTEQLVVESGGSNGRSGVLLTRRLVLELVSANDMSAKGVKLVDVCADLVVVRCKITFHCHYLVITFSPTHQLQAASQVRTETPDVNYVLRTCVGGGLQ